MKPSKIEIFPPLSRVHMYRLKCTLMLTSVPLVCAVVLTTVLYFFAVLNLYFLETGGLIVNEAIQQAYFDQVIMEFGEVWQLLAVLIVATAGVSWLVMTWAGSPFVQGERLLRKALLKKGLGKETSLWLSESPTLTRVVCRLARRLEEPGYAYNDMPEVQYAFNFRFFLKFIAVFYAISILTGYVLSSVFDAIYLKNVSLAINLIKMKQFGHYFVAQENILRSVTWTITGLSCIVYFVMGIYITRYMSNMVFVFKRAIREKHFPLKLRDSDVYHTFANSISDVAEAAGESQKRA